MILSIIENISNEYGGPANSLPNFLFSVKKELDISSRIYSIKIAEKEENEFIDRYALSWINCKLTGPKKLMYSKSLSNAIEADLSNDDIIFSNNLWNYPAYLSAKLAKKHNVPHIISIRGTLYPWSLQQGRWRKKIAWHLFQKKALQQASVVHVTCEDELKAVRALGITTPIALVPHGINYDDYQNLPDREVALSNLNLNKEKKYLLFMSRLHKKKGLDLLLSTWPKLAKEHPDWCLLIVGPDYSNYSKMISELITKFDLHDNIKNLGMLTGEQKYSAFSASNLFILPSFSENFGVVIGEALAAGLPTITTTGTPWTEINEYNCGRCIELSEDNLESTINDFLRCDDKDIAIMSSSAKSLIKDKYSWVYQANKFAKVIDFINKGEIDPVVINI
ncbi:MAG: glycosyltransferase involved in cell wall biosynthesis [Oleiphilaceae bacterium]|jgi:glycosyltransferase involved in cell wall biosynthesis